MIAWIAVLAACSDPSPPVAAVPHGAPAADLTCAGPTRALLDAWIAGDAARVNALYVPDAPTIDLMPQYEQLHAAFPDLTVTVDAVLVDGDRAAASLTLEGTHEGPFIGVPASNRHLTMHLDWWTRCGGGVVHLLDQRSDLLATFAQIGQYPPIVVK